jgi:hypothetical protein
MTQVLTAKTEEASVILEKITLEKKELAEVNMKMEEKLIEIEEIKIAAEVKAEEAIQSKQEIFKELNDVKITVQEMKIEQEKLVVSFVSLERLSMRNLKSMNKF